MDVIQRHEALQTAKVHLEDLIRPPEGMCKVAQYGHLCSLIRRLESLKPFYKAQATEPPTASDVS